MDEAYCANCEHYGDADSGLGVCSLHLRPGYQAEEPDCHYLVESMYAGCDDWAASKEK